MRMTEPRIAGRVSFPLAEDISNEKSNHVSHCIELRIWNPAVDDVCFAGQCVLVERSERRTLGSRRFTAINIGPSDFDPGVYFFKFRRPQMQFIFQFVSSSALQYFAIARLAVSPGLSMP